MSLVEEESVRLALWLVCLAIGALIVLFFVLPALGSSGYMVRRPY